MSETNEGQIDVEFLQVFLQSLNWTEWSRKVRYQGLLERAGASQQFEDSPNPNSKKDD